MPVPLNVLVVDDSAVMRAMVIRTLRMSGLELGEVHQAEHGAAALAVLDAGGHVDVALVDINMPVMTGDELIDRIRARPGTAHLPIVVISTESSRERIEALRARGTEFIHKPFDPFAVRDIVMRAVEGVHV